MSCEECSRIQNLALNKNIAESTPIAYVRIGRANVAIIGCEKHLLELINKLRQGEEN